MELTPTMPKPRPTRTKSNAVKTPATTDKVASKSASHRKAAGGAAQIIESHRVAMTAPGGEDLTQRIATTAYFLAAARNFEPGGELEDWLEAERRIRSAD
jgi:Protein of unknown function (DUF2934)